MKREGGTSSRFKLLIFKAILKQFLFSWVQLRPTIPSFIRRVLSGMILSVLVVFPIFFLGLDGFVRRDARDNVGGYQKIAYYYEQTVAVMGYRSKIPIDCDLVMAEMSDIDEKKRLFNDIRRGTQSMKEISFAEMMSLVRLCNDLEKESQPTHHGASQPNDQPTNEPPATMTSLLSGIFPGTKWCGINDIAVDYHDLGIEEDLDRCCRTHDHCPIKVKAFNSNYGLFNIHPYTNESLEKLKLRRNTPFQNAPILSITLKEMLTLVRLCEDIQKRIMETSSQDNLDTKQPILSGKNSSSKWCGFGKSASGFWDLNYISGVNFCCRSYDHCPISIDAYQMDYGLFNPHPYTVSHCDCNFIFYRCLKDLEREKRRDPILGASKELMQSFYESIGSLPCITTEYPKVCSEILDENGHHKAHLNDSSTFIWRKAFFDLLVFIEEKMTKDVPCVKWTTDYRTQPKYNFQRLNIFGNSIKVVNEV